MKKRTKLRHQLQAAVRSMKKSPNPDTIHAFRVSVKKLRAYLRLLSQGKKKLSLPAKIEKLYHRAGELRNIELYAHTLTEMFAGSEKPTGYFFLLEAERKKRKKKFQIALKNLKISRIKKMLPHGNHASDASGSVQAFTKIKQRQVNEIVHKGLTSDTDFHNIRKYMKDMMYNGGESAAHKQETKEITDELGVLMDRSVALSFFKKSWLQKISVAERKEMEQVHQLWEAEKNGMEKKLGKELEQMTR